MNAEWLRFAVEMAAAVALVVKVSSWAGKQEQLLTTLNALLEKLTADFERHEQNDERRFEEIGEKIADVRVEALQALQARGKH